jgi:hypothetical protein
MQALWWTRKGFDWQRAGGYSPLDFPPLGRFVLGFLETEQDRGRSRVCRTAFEVERAA